MRLRVISGIKRGLKLESLDGLDTRPTLDRVKESIFNMIFDASYGTKILDLFAGSGAMGIEALSRGGEHAVFVDKNADACKIVGNNIKKAGFENVSVIYNKDSLDYLKDAARQNLKFDIIFLDPPYALGLLDKTLATISEYGVLSSEGIIIVEYDDGTDVDIHDFKLLKDKRYGRVRVNILEA